MKLYTDVTENMMNTPAQQSAQWQQQQQTMMTAAAHSLLLLSVTAECNTNDCCKLLKLAL